MTNKRLVCGQSNMHSITREDYDNGMRTGCTEENPCDCCLRRLGMAKLEELIKERDALEVDDE